MKLILSETHPEHAATWHPTKNGALLPSEVSPSSRKMAWWKCPETDGEWEQAIDKRTNAPAESPFVRNLMLLQGYNDIASRRPDLVAEWHPTKNGTLTPKDVRINYSKKVWWRDPITGGEWEASPKTRNSGPGRNPFVKGQKLLVGHNDLATHVPGIEQFWSEKNTNKPSELLSQSNKDIYLVDPENAEEWKTSPYKVSSRFKSTGEIRRIRIATILVEGVNDLATTHPEIAKTWHPEKNFGVTPADVTAGSTKPVWWLCPISKGEWKSPPITRVKLKEISPFVGGKVLLKGFNDIATTHPDLAKEWHPTLNRGYQPEDFVAGSAFQAWWVCNTTKKVWNAPIYNRTRTGVGVASGSPYVTPAQSSREKELLTYLQELLPGEVILERDKKLIAPFEIDMYIPSRNIGIEFNGLYWHSELWKKPDAHQRKQEAAIRAGLTLLTVWEDDWNNRQQVVKKMLTHKLGLTPPEERVGARKTVLTTASSSEARDFTEANHIQGYKAGSRYTCLRFNGEIVALGVWRKVGKTLYLERYCSSVNVPGGFTKLLKEAFSWSKEKGMEEIVTFADMLVSNGDLYVRNGFKETGILKPDYSYFYRNRRVHKFNFRKTRFKNDPDLLWQKGLTEQELAKLNNIPRIWDAGKIRYSLRLTSE